MPDNLQSQPLIIRKIKNKQELDKVYELVYQEYLEQGYCQPNNECKLRHYPHLDQTDRTTVLIAEIEGEIVGSISSTLDGGPGSLHVDEDFGVECDKIRKEAKEKGLKLGASWRIVTKKKFQTRRVVFGLMQEMVSRWVLEGGDIGVFTFNPKHEQVYKKLFKMKTVARCNKVKSLDGNQPAVFMRMDTYKIPEKWFRTPEERAAWEEAKKRAVKKQNPA